MASVNAFITDVLDPSVREIFNDRRDELSASLKYKELGLVDKDAELPNETIQGVSGVGKGVLTVELQQYGANERYRDYTSSLTMRKYTSELYWSEEDVHFLQKASRTKRAQEINDMADGAAQALNYNIDEDVAKFFYLAFGTTFFTGGDGKALIAGDHPTRKAGASAQSNLPPTTHFTFSGDNLITMIERMDRFKGMNDIQLEPTSDLVVLHSLELDDTVDRVLNSEFGPDTANLGNNPASTRGFNRRGKKISHRVIEYMPSAYSNYWFVVDRKRAARAAFLYWGWKPRMAADTDTRKGAFYNDSSVLFGPHARHWRWISGSKGSGAAV